MALAIASARADGPKDEVLAYQVRGVLQKHCQSCHSGANAKAGLQILDHDGLLDRKLVATNAAGFAELVQRVDEGSMPPGDRDKLSAKERDILHAWQQAKSPFFPSTFGEQVVHDAILKDVSKLGAEKSQARYISLNHLVADPQAGEALQLYRAALERAMGSMPAKKAITAPLTAIDRAATIFRISIADLSWSELAYETKLRPDPLQLTLMDVVLLSYPYGTTQQSSETWTRLEQDYLKPANQIRPILYIRGDWLAGAMLVPKPMVLPAYPTADITDAAKRYALPLTMDNVLAELGSWISEKDFRDRIGKAPALREPLAALLDKGEPLARADWEKLYPELVALLGPAEPLWNLDSLPRPDIQPDALKDRIDFYTYNCTEKKRSDVFTPFQQMYVAVKNTSKDEQYVEVIYQNIEKEAFLLRHKGSVPGNPVKVFKLEPGQEIYFPQYVQAAAPGVAAAVTGGMAIDLIISGQIVDKKQGKDKITILVSDKPFAAATEEKMRDLVPDRVVHALRTRQPNIIRQKTITMETLEK